MREKPSKLEIVIRGNTRKITSKGEIWLNFSENKEKGLKHRPIFIKFPLISISYFFKVIYTVIIIIIIFTSF